MPLNTELKIKLREMIERHEKLELKPYLDTVGKLTIGIGRNLDDVGISKDEAIYLFENDINPKIEFMLKYTWFNYLSDNRKLVILDMVFNLGVAGFFEFKKLIKAIERGEFKIAADEMIDSKWFKQVGKRSKELERMMRNG